MDIDFENNLRYKHYLSKFVKVKTVDENFHEGWLKCIDPLTGNLILVILNEDNSLVLESCLIHGADYTDVELLKDVDNDIKSLIKKYYCGEGRNPVNVEARKIHIISWMKKHRIPVREISDGGIMVCESVSIFPPYFEENCSSLNGRVLLRIREILQSLPEEETKSPECKEENYTQVESPTSNNPIKE
ncbi:gem-associated protein 6-like [Stegodyphus dumicola]|uniref:gem-associated protein 6-like n=1 Tax=Stegodyphus dumicola TaxID=202533 RepID=UPI0015AD5B07|nr:gem-associated protein 6-like [Stegodyphus dumicola]